MGLAGNDTLQGLSGNDLIDGGTGIDTALWTESIQDYDISKVGAAWHVSHQNGNDGTDTLHHVERLQFVDAHIALDLDGNAGATARIIGATVGAAAVRNPLFVGVGLYYLEQLGYSPEQLMQLVLQAKLGPNASHAAVVDLLFVQIAGVAPSREDLAHFVGLLDNHTYSVPELALLAANSELNARNINLVGLTDQGLAFTPQP